MLVPRILWNPDFYRHEAPTNWHKSGEPIFFSSSMHRRSRLEFLERKKYKQSIILRVFIHLFESLDFAQSVEKGGGGLVPTSRNPRIPRSGHKNVLFTIGSNDIELFREKRERNVEEEWRGRKRENSFWRECAVNFVIIED